MAGRESTSKFAKCETKRLQGTIVAKSDICQYEGFGGKTMQLLKVLIKQKDSKPVKLYNYNPDTFKAFTEGQILLLPEVKADDGHFILHAGHRAFRCGIEELVPHEREEAQELLSKPLSEFCTIEEVKNSPQKRKLSLEGRVVAGEMMNDAKSRKVTLQDKTGCIKVLLWKSSSSVHFNVGDNLQILDGVASFDSLEKANAVNVNRPDQVVITQETQSESVTLIGVEDDKVYASRDNIEGIFSVKMDALLSTVKCSNIEQLVAALPININAKVVSDELTDMSMV